MKKNTFIFIIALGTLLLPAFNALGQDFEIVTIRDPHTGRMVKAVKNQLIIKLKGGATTSASVSTLNSEVGAKSKGWIPGARRAQVLEVSDGADLGETIERYRSDPSVEYAEPNYIAYVSALPNDPLVNTAAQPWNYWWLRNDGNFTFNSLPVVSNKDVDADLAWDLNTGGSSSITVAIIDTGVDYDHEDLNAPGKVIKGNDYTDGPGTITDNDPMDEAGDGHGTHVAGIAAAAGNNSKGMAGLAYNATIIAVRVLKNGVGTHADIAAGINNAVALGANIINLSLGGVSPSQTLQNAVDAANAAGVLVIAAAGNGDVPQPDGDGINGTGDPFVIYPAAYTSVMAVAASDHRDKITSFSNYGASIEVSAPGFSILSTCTDGLSTCAGADGIANYTALNGTSMATPVVAGLAALIWSHFPSLTNQEVRDIIKGSSENIDALNDPKYSGKIGNGRINAHQALSSLIISVAPSNGSISVPSTTDITVNFSQAMDQASVQNAFSTNPITTGTFSWVGDTMTYNPTNNLTIETTYTVTIGTGAMSTSGSTLSSDYSWSFTTLDITAPEVAGVTPLDGSIDVSVNTDLTVTFNELMDQTSVQNASSINPKATGTFSWGGNTMTYNPSSDLSAGNLYTVTIGTGAKDLSGNSLTSAHNWSFTTGDAVAPEVTSVTPLDGSTDVNVTTDIKVTFNEGMDQTSVQSAFSTSPSSTGTFSWSGNTMTYNPSSNLSPEATYTVTIGTGAKDDSGNSLTGEYGWSFTTEDITAPEVASVAPLDGSTNVEVNTDITVTFSEGMDQASVQSAFSTSPSIEGTFSWSGSTLTFTPLSGLGSLVNYTLTIGSGAADLAGNSLSTPYTWSFTTVAILDPTQINIIVVPNPMAGYYLALKI